MTKGQKNSIIMVLPHLESIQNSIDDMNKIIDDMTVPFESAIALLCTIPIKVNTYSAITVFDTLKVVQ